MSFDWSSPESGPRAFDWSAVDLEKVEAQLLSTVPEGRDPKEWFEEQYLNRPVTFEPHRS